MSLKIVVRVANKVVPEPYPVETERFGVKISNLIGTVDADGTYVVPNEPFVLDLTGVKKIMGQSFAYFGNRQGIKVESVIADDVVEVQSAAFSQFSGDQYIVIKKVSFNSLETINATNVFGHAFKYCQSASFQKLKKIKGDYLFQYCFNRSSTKSDDVFNAAFPALEEISGNDVFGSVVWSSSSYPASLTLNSVKKIVGATGHYNSTFQSVSGDIFLPQCNYVEKYICSTSYTTNLHFARENQAAIEACDGYTYKFGAKNIFFDL